MSKATVTRLFVGSLIAGTVGAVAVILAVAVALANDVFVLSGSELVGIQQSGLAWVLLVLAVGGGVAIVAAFVGGLVSWIGALLNTAQLESKAWFLVLLLVGIFNLGILVMIAYMIAGPDITTSRGRTTATASAAA